MKKWMKKNDKSSRSQRAGGFLYFSSVFNVDMDRKGFVSSSLRPFDSRNQDSRSWKTDELLKIWHNMTPEERRP